MAQSLPVGFAGLKLAEARQLRKDQVLHQVAEVIQDLVRFAGTLGFAGHRLITKPLENLEEFLPRPRACITGSRAARTVVRGGDPRAEALAVVTAGDRLPQFPRLDEFQFDRVAHVPDLMQIGAGLGAAQHEATEAGRGVQARIEGVEHAGAVAQRPSLGRVLFRLEEEGRTAALEMQSRILAISREIPDKLHVGVDILRYEG